MPTQPAGPIEITEQSALSQSFDKLFNQLAVELLGASKDLSKLYRLTLNTDGSLAQGSQIPLYDYFSVSSTSTQDVYTFKTGGSGGTAVRTVTINYVDSSKQAITNYTAV